jgi:hypothetical protein
LGAKVKDLTKPGWIANTANSQRVMHEATGSEIPEGSIIILDVLGNSSVRFEQADDSCSLPVKVNGSWHLLGKVKVMEDEQVEKCLFTVEHLGKQLHRDSWKIYVSPSPRWLRGHAAMTFRTARTFAWMVMVGSSSMTCTGYAAA